MLAVHRDHFRNLAAVKFPRERVARRQDSMGRVGKSFPNAVDAAMVGRNKVVALGKVSRDSQAGGAGRSRQSGRNQFAAGEQDTHEPSSSLCDGLLRGRAESRPVIIGQVRDAKPARKTMATWTRTKSTIAMVVKK